MIRQNRAGHAVLGASPRIVQNLSALLKPREGKAL
jgi:hypothetical protein